MFYTATSRRFVIIAIYYIHCTKNNGAQSTEWFLLSTEMTSLNQYSNF